MIVKRLDLGADVIHLPSRDLLVLHPDLDYAESIGAVAATLPHLHFDTVMQLVEQVTARPKKVPVMRRIAPIGVRMALASIVSIFAVLHLVPESATAGPTFDGAWQQQMAAQGLTCTPADDAAVQTCVDKRGGVAEVRGFRRNHSSLYMLVRDGRDPSWLLIFDSRGWAERYKARHPHTTMTGRVAVW